MVALATSSFLHVVYLRTLHPLAGVPGPWLGSVTKLWLLWQMRSLAIHKVDLALHATYGPVVRVAPNEVHISDPTLVKKIYGAGSKYQKGDWYSKSLVAVSRSCPSMS